MPNAIPAGPVAVAVDGLRTLIANVDFFQTWVGAPGDPTTALGSVFSGEVGVQIKSLQITSGVLTITTRRPHNITAGSTVSTSGSSLGQQSGLLLIGNAENVGVPTPLTITTDVARPDQGPLYPDFAFVIAGTRPFAVVCESTDSLRSATIGTGGASVMSGSLDVLLEADVSDGYMNDPFNAPIEARNASGQFVQRLLQTQGTGDLMLLNGVELVSCDFIAVGEQNDNTVRYERWRALVRCTWGLEG